MQALRRNHPSGVVVVSESFAAPMKSFLSDMGVQKGQPSWRSIMQWLGDEDGALKQHMGDHVFAQALHRRVKRESRNWRNMIVLVDDLRYEYERTFLQEYTDGGVVTIYLTRSFKSTLNSAEKGHSSEQHQNITVDYTIDLDPLTPEQAAEAAWQQAWKGLETIWV
jgi:hypothetical protein